MRILHERLIMSAVALLRRNHRPSDDEIRTALLPHLCRCGIYVRAVRAVRRVAELVT
jgi:aerobic-type carbon monoxide dehydrogenase small subunit (CoxS/CutS family)